MNFYTNVYMRGNKIYYRGYDMGLPIKEVVSYKPYLFVPKKGGTFKSLEGREFAKMEFDDIKSARDFYKRYEEVENFEIYGLNQFLYLFIYDHFPDHIVHDPDLVKKVTIDIECAADDGFPDIQKADKEITAITLRHRGTSFVFGCGEFTTTDKSICYVKCINESELLYRFIQSWESIEPEIVTGWNIEFFDIPYLINRIKNVLGDEVIKKLSPWRMIEEKDIEFKGRVNHTYFIAGVSTLDYFQLYRKFTFGNKESYKLDYIAQIELGEKKLDYSEYGSLLSLYKQNFQKFIEYNIHDCVLVDRLDERLNFINQVMTFAYDAKVNYLDTLTTVRPSDMIIHASLLNRGIVIPPVKHNNVLDTLAGGHVKEPKLGESEWVVSFDLDSLYPHIIMGWNISPETFIARQSIGSVDTVLSQHVILSDEYPGKSVCGNGCTYRKDFQGFLPTLMQTLYDDRVKYKKLMIEAKKDLELINIELTKR